MKNDEDLGSLRESIYDAASVASFRSNPITVYRQHLKSKIQSAVSSAKKKSGDFGHEFWCYDLVVLRELLVFPWEELCSAYDHQDLTYSTTDKTYSTPLQELITMLQDNSVLPPAFAVISMALLLEAILQSPRRLSAAAPPGTMNNATGMSTTSRWTPSQLLLLKNFAILWKKYPPLKHSVSETIWKVLEVSTNFQTPHKWNRLLSSLAHVAGDCSRAYHTMMRTILDILKRVDCMEIELILVSPKEDTANSCQLCQTQPTLSGELFAAIPKRPRWVRTATLDDLHENDLSTTDYRPLIRPQRRLLNGGLSLKQILSRKFASMRTQCPCSCLKQNSVENVSHENFSEWALVRSRAYKKFISLLARPPVWDSLTRPVMDASKFDLGHLIQAAHDEYRSPCIRLCLLLASYNSTSSVQCRRVVLALFSRFKTTLDPLWLRIFTEAINSWSCFDRRKECWNAFHPFQKYVEQLLLSSDEEECGGTLHPEWCNTHRAAFRAMASIFSCRGRLFLLEQDLICADFERLLVRLKIHCGDIEIWFDELEIQQLDDEHTDFSTLCRFGILGLTCLALQVLAEPEDGECNNEKKDDESSSLCPAIQSWPFSAPFDLRSAYNRLGNYGQSRFQDWKELMTNSDFDENIGKILDSRKNTSGKSQCVAPLNDYIHNPYLLIHIFEYARYDEVVKYRQVCKAWQSVIDSSNSLWRSLYLASFPVHSQDPKVAFVSENYDWKQWLVQKHVNERSLLHRRNTRTGYKYRTCSYLGCYQVLRTEKLAESHLASHERQAKAIKKRAQEASATSSKKRKRKDSSSAEPKAGGPGKKV